MTGSLFPSSYRTLAELVSQYSPSGSERSAVEYMIKRAEELGFTRSFIDEAGNAVCVMGSGPKLLVLLGHIDTVPGEIEVRVDGDTLYGRGSVDAKGPLSTYIDAVSKVGEVEGWQFVVIGAVEEERESNGARFVSTQYDPDFAIIGEPNRWDRVALGYKGSAWADLIVTSDQTHTAHNELSACEKVIEDWNNIKQYAAVYNADKPKMFDQILLTIREMTSADEGFSQTARLRVNARLPLEVSPADWYATLARLAPHAEIEPRGFAIPAYACEKNSVLVRSFLAGIRQVGGNPGFVFKSGTADLNIVAPVWKCPAVVYGPGDSALDHTPNEHISIEEYQKAVEALTASIQALITRG